MVTPDSSQHVENYTHATEKAPSWHGAVGTPAYRDVGDLRHRCAAGFHQRRVFLGGRGVSVLPHRKALHVDEPGHRGGRLDRAVPLVSSFSGCDVVSAAICHAQFRAGAGVGARSVEQAGLFLWHLHIYAFPVQQSLASIWPSMSVWAHVSLAFVGAAGLAGLSWHWVEAPALRFKPSRRRLEVAG